MNSFKFIHNECDEYVIEWSFQENKLSVEYTVTTTDFLNNIEVFCKGYVKWDGCSNWHFPDFEKCMFHACTMQQLEVLSSLPIKCWEHASEVMKDNFQGTK